MADNTTLNPGALGDVIATEDVGGVKLPVSKLRLGKADTDGGDVVPHNPLPTSDERVIALLESIDHKLGLLLETLG